MLAVAAPLSCPFRDVLLKVVQYTTYAHAIPRHEINGLPLGLR